MKQGDVIGGYEILRDFIVAGGMSKVSFAREGDTEYFIKEFLSPKYPVAGAPGGAATLARRQKQCDEFEMHHKKLNDAIGSKCGFGGNLVYAIDFFRDGTSYYKVTEKIEIASLSTRDIATLPLEKILIILKTVTHSVKILHDLGIVHGDLKPDNILIKQTVTGGYTTKLIDFDNSYFSGLPPENKEEVVGTPEYYSPELAHYIKSGETGEDKARLTVQSDLFALGVIFTEYLTGEKPGFPKSCQYTWEAVNRGIAPELKGGGRTGKLRALLMSMLQADKDKRPSITETFSQLKDPDITKEVITETKEGVAAITTSKLVMSKNLRPEAAGDKTREAMKPKSAALRVKGLNTDK